MSESLKGVILSGTSCQVQTYGLGVRNILCFFVSNLFKRKFDWRISEYKKKSKTSQAQETECLRSKKHFSAKNSLLEPI